MYEIMKLLDLQKIENNNKKAVTEGYPASAHMPPVCISMAVYVPPCAECES